MQLTPTAERLRQRIGARGSGVKHSLQQCSQCLVSLGNPFEVNCGNLVLYDCAEDCFRIQSPQFRTEQKFEQNQPLKSRCPMRYRLDRHNCSETYSARCRQAVSQDLQIFSTHQDRKTEVYELRVAVLADHDIFRFDVTMYDSWVCAASSARAICTPMRTTSASEIGSGNAFLSVVPSTCP